MGGVFIRRPHSSTMEFESAKIQTSIHVKEREHVKLCRTAAHFVHAHVIHYGQLLHS